MTTTVSKTELLHSVGRDYVLKGLGELNFDAIPYADEVKLRAPLNPGGSKLALEGKENLRTQWFAPLPSLVAGVELIETYVNADKNAVAAEFHCHITNPACTLRIIDKFIINDEGKIIEQENFFDPREVTNPT
jgi:ketosteroid isomerase-like protein